MKYRNIQLMHEIRLGITQVVVPLIVGGCIYFSNEENKKAAKQKFEDAKCWVASKLNK